ncbi:MAG TPA: sensor histidine kinase [Puia sp.]|nr:sensor histidine kinase [Puia sp.]
MKMISSEFMKSHKPYSFSFLTLVSLFFFYSIHAQNIPDSLLQKLARASNDSIKARTLLDIGETIESGFLEKSSDYYRQALTISKAIKNPRLLLSSLNDIGICLMEQNKLDSAILIFQQAVPVAWSIKDTFRVARVLGNTGNAYLLKKNRVKAIEYYMRSITLWEGCANQDGLSSFYANICDLFYEQREFDKAIEYGKKGYALAIKMGDNYSAANSLVNLSNVYYDTKQIDTMYELLTKALPLARKFNDVEQMATVYESLGNYYFEKNVFPSALSNYQQSYKYILQLANQFHICEICYRLARTYMKLNQTTKAFEYIIKAEELAKKVGARANLNDIYEVRAEMEQRAGHYKLASEYFSKSLDLSDSLFRTSTSEKVADIEAQYQNVKKQGEITRLEKDREIQSLSLKQQATINYFLIASLATILLIAFLGYRNFRNRHLLEKKEAELQQNKISELEKDRQLIAVDSMLKGQEDERSRLAKDLHDGLGGLLSGVKFSLSNMKDNLIITPDNMAVFERSLDMLDTSIKELRRVAHNMMPEILTRFGLDEALKEYCNTINATKLVTVKYQSLGMDPRLDQSVEIILFRIVQELLNNILKHAAATEAFIQLIREDHRLNVVVEDNGKGFDAVLTENKQGAGWVSIRSRVDYLKGQLDIHTEEGKGTMVNIEFNV